MAYEAGARSIPELEAILRQAERRRLPEPSIRRHWRVRAGFTQGGTADAVNAVLAALSPGKAVTRVAVTRWESGTRTPRGVFAEAYATVLDRFAAEVGGRG